MSGTSSLRDHLQAIYEKHGKLTPQIVVDEFRPEDHELHSRLEWDNEIGGEAYRRIQAHEMIRSVKVVYRPATDDEPAVMGRAFHAVRIAQGHVYEPNEKIVADPFLQQLVLQDMEREWRALYQRYSTYQQFIQLVRETVSV